MMSAIGYHHIFVQYIVESLAAARLQRGWRGHRIVRTLKQTVRTQIAALRIQRFMRDWKQRTRSMTLRLAVASAMELRWDFY